MKRKILVLAVLLSSCFTIQAQVGVSVNIGVQPVWGPVGYDHADYYYLPDIEAYYNVPLGEYTWNDDGRWVTTPNLPPRYANFDLYHSYKVVINQPTPWLRHDAYRRQYYQFRGRRDQAVIRDSRDNRYWANPNHPEHAHWNNARPAERHDGERHGQHGEGRHDAERHGEHRDGRGEEHGRR